MPSGAKGIALFAHGSGTGAAATLVAAVERPDAVDAASPPKQLEIVPRATRPGAH